MFSEQDHEEIEQQCLNSWMASERFCKEIAKSNSHYEVIFDLIAEFRRRGYDRLFVAEIDHGILHISHLGRGIDRDLGVCIRFAFPRQSGMVVQFIAQNVNVVLRVATVTLTPDVENLLTLLLAYPMVNLDRRL